MALTLIKEDGTGKPTANTYALVADGDAYHEGHLYASFWTSASAAQKSAALVFATRLIDTQYQFGGNRAGWAQALQWPRSGCPEPDGGTAAFGTKNIEQAALHGIPPEGLTSLVLQAADWVVPASLVPKVVVEATCELARELLLADRTSAPEGEGLKYHNAGTTQFGYDKSDTPPIIPKVVQAMLAKYGTLLSAKSGAVRLIRA